MDKTKKEFIEFMMEADVLRFGSFVTKSGRNTVTEALGTERPPTDTEKGMAYLQSAAVPAAPCRAAAAARQWDVLPCGHGIRSFTGQCFPFFV